MNYPKDDNCYSDRTVAYKDTMLRGTDIKVTFTDNSFVYLPVEWHKRTRIGSTLRTYFLDSQPDPTIRGLFVDGKELFYSPADLEAQPTDPDPATEPHRWCHDCDSPEAEWEPIFDLPLCQDCYRYRLRTEDLAQRAHEAVLNLAIAATFGRQPPNQFAPQLCAALPKLVNPGPSAPTTAPTGGKENVR